MLSLVYYMFYEEKDAIIFINGYGLVLTIELYNDCLLLILCTLQIYMYLFPNYFTYFFSLDWFNVIFHLSGWKCGIKWSNMSGCKEWMKL